MSWRRRLLRKTERPSDVSNMKAESWEKTFGAAGNRFHGHWMNTVQNEA